MVIVGAEEVKMSSQNIKMRFTNENEKFTVDMNHTYDDVDCLFLYPGEDEKTGIQTVKTIYKILESIESKIRMYVGSAIDDNSTILDVINKSGVHPGKMFIGMTKNNRIFKVYDINEFVNKIIDVIDTDERIM